MADRRGVNPIIDTSYSLPLNCYDTTFTAYYRRNAFLVVENPFRHFGSQRGLGDHRSHPAATCVPDGVRRICVALTGEHVYLKTTSAFDAPGLPSLFIPGSSTTGVATVSALRFSQEYIHRSPSFVFAALSRFQRGAERPWRNDQQWPSPGRPVLCPGWARRKRCKRLEDWWGLQLLGRVAAQIANDRLFPLEQMPVGGRFTVRGYRENTLVRDDAVLASIESRFPLFRFASGEDRLQFAQFVDFGHAWNAKGDTPDPLQTWPVSASDYVGASCLRNARASKSTGASSSITCGAARVICRIMESTSISCQVL